MKPVLYFSAIPLLLVGCGKQADDSGEAAISCDHVALEVPGGLGELQGAWDASRKRMVFFGGNQAVPINCAPGATDFVGRTWAWEDACDGFVKIDTVDAPTKRGRYAAALDEANGRLVLHGGRFRQGDSGDYTLRKDTWAFDFATDSWSKLDGGNKGPTPRFDHGGAVIDGKLWLFGGNDSPNGAVFTPTNDTWSFDLATQTWTEESTTGSPPRRLYHVAATDGKRLFFYGGGDENALFGGGFYGDLWALDTTTLEWTELHSGSGDAPLERIWSSLAYDGANDRLILFGGHDGGELGNNNELWQFNLKNKNWRMLTQGDTYNRPAYGVCDFPADFTNVDPNSPERRAAAAWTLTDDNRFMVFGGKTDCGNANDVWALDLDTEVWTMRSRATEGEVCLRASQQCSSMCF